MDPVYQYTPSADFIHALRFDHIATYSLQRGPVYETALQRMRPEYDRLRARNGLQQVLSQEEQQHLAHYQKLLGFTQYLQDDNGAFHFSSIKTSEWKLGSPVIQQLKEILCTEALNIPYWMCAPVYRDAIVFYNAGHQIVCSLNVCLSCKYMETAPFQHINADEKTYEQLKEFFIELGHPVEQ